MLHGPSQSPSALPPAWQESAATLRRSIIRGPSAQGGCAAMEDSVVLARRLRTAWTGDDRCLQAALAEYERERMKRCWPLALRSRLIGAALQSTLPPVVALRDAAVRYAVRPSLLFGHTLFDAGRL